MDLETCASPTCARSTGARVPRRARAREPSTEAGQRGRTSVSASASVDDASPEISEVAVVVAMAVSAGRGRWREGVGGRSSATVGGRRRGGGARTSASASASASAAGHRLPMKEETILPNRKGGSPGLIRDPRKEAGLQAGTSSQMIATRAGNAMSRIEAGQGIERMLAVSGRLRGVAGGQWRVSGSTGCSTARSARAARPAAGRRRRGAQACAARRLRRGGLPALPRAPVICSPLAGRRQRAAHGPRRQRRKWHPRVAGRAPCAASATPRASRRARGATPARSAPLAPLSLERAALGFCGNPKPLCPLCPLPPPLDEIIACELTPLERVVLRFALDAFFVCVSIFVTLKNTIWTHAPRRRHGPR